MFPHAAVRDFWWLALASGGVAARYVKSRSRARLTNFSDPEPIVQRLLAAQAEHGYNAHSLVSIAPGAMVWQCSELPGAIVYNEFGKVWLVPGDPLAAPQDIKELTALFIEAAREAKRFVAFMPTTARFASNAPELGLHAIKVGAAPYFDLTTWGPRGDRAKKARAGVNQARRAGVNVSRVENIDESLQAETALLCERWLTTRRCSMKLGWLFDLNPFQHSDRKKFFTARDASGSLVGFLAASAMPARCGWYLEDVIRLPSAPVGTADLLVVEALAALKAAGAKIATLGTSPLAKEGAVAAAVGNSESLTRFVHSAARSLAVFYNFEGLRRFKMKFAPSWWESEYLLFPFGVKAPPHIARAFIQAIAPQGASRMAAQQLARVMHLRRRERDQLSENDDSVSLRGTTGSGTLIAQGTEMRPTIPISELEAQPLEHVLDQTARNYLGEFVSVAGLRLHYASKGSGRPVVFIHGNPGSYQDYSLTMLGETARSYRALAFDRPGHGYSERPDGAGMTVEVQADLLRQALQKLAVETPIIVGHSWGGSVALAMALQCEDDLAGLVLLAPAAYPSEGPQWWASLPNLPVFGKLILKVLTPLIGRRLIKDNLRDAYHPQPIQEDYLKAAEELWTRDSQVKACAYDDTSLDRSLAELSKQYQEIRLPTVIVTGDSDVLLKPAEQAARLHRSIPGAELICLPKTGHQIPLTHPGSVNHAITRVMELIARS